MQSFYTYTPAGRRSPESSFLAIEHDGRFGGFKIEWASFEGSGSRERWNEDSLLVAGDDDRLLFAVFDGVTPVPGSSVPNGGHVAAKHALAGVLVAFLDGLYSPRDLLLRGNAAIQKVSAELGITPGDPIHSLACTGTLVCIDALAGKLDYAGISDSALLIKRAEAPAERVTGNLVLRFEEAAMKARKAAQANPVGSSPEDVFWEKVKANRRFQNAPNAGGYGVLNGMDPALVRQYIEAPDGSLPLGEIDRFVLLTDGAELNERHTPPDKWQRFDAELFSMGSLAFLEHVRALEDQDPQCQIYPRVKHHDDATVIAVQRIPRV